MDILLVILQSVVALGIYNVWIVRFEKATRWRGKTAQNMREEFVAYGLPSWFLEFIRVFKLLFATLLIVGIWYPLVVAPAAIGLGILMLGAISMHIKVKDPIRKTLPAIGMFILVLSIVLFTQLL